MINVLMMFVFRSKSLLSFLEQLFLVMELRFTLNFYALLGIVLEERDGDKCLSPFRSLQACLRWGRMACFLHLQLARLPLVDGRGATNNQTDSPPPPPTYKVFYIYIYIYYFY